jgi:hypothetical protein
MRSAVDGCAGARALLTVRQEAMGRVTPEAIRAANYVVAFAINQSIGATPTADAPFDLD